ncbi:MAG TPA: DUF819 family protein [Flavisolibacter sp.]|nr:DUF819 family protein [Flavisolibacter sp.]
MLSNPVYVATVLLLLVLFAEWLGQRKYFHYLGAALIVIIATAILANLNLLPSSQNPSPLYDGIFTYAAPLAIFFLLLDVRLKDLKAAGLPTVVLFLAGSLTTITGTLVGYYLLAPQKHGVTQAYAVAGMYTGTYIGGSANLNAVALQYGINKNGTLFAAINAADNIITTIWIIATIVLPPFLQRWLPRKKTQIGNQASMAASAVNTDTIKESMTIISLSLLLALGFGSLLLSQAVSLWVPQIPPILTLTTIALVLAQTSFVGRLKGGRVMGYFLVLLFLAVVGAYCDIAALVNSGELALALLAWVTVIVFIHGLLLFGLGGLFSQDWDIVSIASNANIGGATSAAVLATSLGRADLRLPGILVGSVGNAIGTYLGILIAEFLK